MSHRPAGGVPRPLLLLCLFFLALTGWSIHRATSGVSAVTDPSYYRHGLRYNGTLLERRAAVSLGWQVAAALREGRLELRLSGPDGRPVTGGEGEVVFLTGGGSGQILQLKETAEGVYSIPLPAALRGEIAARLHLGRAGARISRNLLLHL